MGRFSKRRVVIEAVQFTGDNEQDVVEWGGVTEDGANIVPSTVEQCLIIPTLEGEMRANVGDWIIRGLKGELYPCRPDIFEMTYEPADSPAPSTGPVDPRNGEPPSEDWHRPRLTPGCAEGER